MKRFFKNKIGSEIIETILIIPIFIWLIIFSLFKVWVTIDTTNASIFSERYARNMAIGTTFDNALDNVAKNYNSDYKITKIVLSSSSETLTLTFSDIDASKTSFATFINGTDFDLTSYYVTLDNDYRIKLRNFVNSHWNRDTKVNVLVTKSLLSKEFQDAFALNYFDPIEQKSYSIKLGFDTEATSESSSIIYFKGD